MDCEVVESFLPVFFLTLHILSLLIVQTSHPLSDILDLWICQVLDLVLCVLILIRWSLTLVQLFLFAHHIKQLINLKLICIHLPSVRIELLLWHVILLVIVRSQWLQLIDYMKSLTLCTFCAKLTVPALHGKIRQTDPLHQIEFLQVQHYRVSVHNYVRKGILWLLWAEYWHAICWVKQDAHCRLSVFLTDQHGVNVHLSSVVLLLFISCL